MRSKSACSIILVTSFLLNCGTGCIQNEESAVQHKMDVVQNKANMEIDIVAVAASPDKEYLATSYIFSGGGGAGYVYQVVNVRRQGEPFDPEKGIVLSITKTNSLTLIWKDDEHLTIKHSKPRSIYKQVDEWSGKRKIRISYLIE